MSNTKEKNADEMAIYYRINIKLKENRTALEDFLSVTPCSSVVTVYGKQMYFLVTPETNSSVEKAIFIGVQPNIPENSVSLLFMDATDMDTSKMPKTVDHEDTFNHSNREYLVTIASPLGKITINSNDTLDFVRFEPSPKGDKELLAQYVKGTSELFEYWKNEPVKSPSTNLIADETGEYFTIFTIINDNDPSSFSGLLQILKTVSKNQYLRIYGANRETKHLEAKFIGLKYNGTATIELAFHAAEFMEWDKSADGYSKKQATHADIAGVLRKNKLGVHIVNNHHGYVIEQYKRGKHLWKNLDQSEFNDEALFLEKFQPEKENTQSLKTETHMSNDIASQPEDNPVIEISSFKATIPKAARKVYDYLDVYTAWNEPDVQQRFQAEHFTLLCPPSQLGILLNNEEALQENTSFYNAFSNYSKATPKQFAYLAHYTSFVVTKQLDMDWRNANKMHWLLGMNSEIRELKLAIRSGDVKNYTEELGDQFFFVISYARAHGVLWETLSYLVESLFVALDSKQLDRYVDEEDKRDYIMDMYDSVAVLADIEKGTMTSDKPYTYTDVITHITGYIDALMAAVADYTKLVDRTVTRTQDYDSPLTGMEQVLGKDFYKLFLILEDNKAKLGYRHKDGFTAESNNNRNEEAEYAAMR